MITLAITAVMAAAQATGAPTMSRDRSLINAFQVFCQIDNLTFDQLDKKYLEMKLPVVQDLHPPSEGATVVRSKSWLGGLTDGPFQLVATEKRMPGKIVEGCGLSALDSGGEVFRQEVVKELGLGAPNTQNADTRLRASVWNQKNGGRYVLLDASPEQKSGFLLTYEFQSKGQSQGAD